MAYAVEEEIHRYLLPDLRSEVLLAMVQNIVAIKAFLWHFQICVHQDEILKVLSIDSTELVQLVSRHATGH